MEEFREFVGKVVYVQQTNGEVNIGKLLGEGENYIKVASEHHIYYINKSAIAKLWIKGGVNE